MKKSNFKLSLNKMTISNLDSVAMNNKVGGITGKGCGVTWSDCGPKTQCLCPAPTFTAGPPIKK